MAGGIPFTRDYVLVLEDGCVVLDWGDGQYQDVATGGFFLKPEGLVCRKIENAELERLKRAGQVERFDRQEVYFINLAERPSKTID
jgi:hypothetical protein